MVTGIAVMDLLHPAIVDITPQGLVISCDVTAEELGLSEADERLAGPLSVNLEVRQEENAITVAGTVEGASLRQCVRCLSEYEDPLYVTVYADYLRQAEGASKSGPLKRVARRSKVRAQEAAMEDADEQDEIYFYQGDHVDLTPMLREQIILVAPMQPLCREDCAGLCPKCGQNLNEWRCGCELETIKSPFRILEERREGNGRNSGT
jgi:uncharacterized protein